MTKARLLVADRPAPYQALLTAAGYELTCEPALDAALSRASQESFDLAIVALRPGVDGLSAAKALLALDAEMPLVVVAERPTLDSATACLRLGAGEYVDETLVAAELPVAVERLLDRRRLGAEHQLLRRQLERPYGFGEFIGTSPAMRRVFETIEQVAASNVDVLLFGATGTGKELVARAIHQRSRRAQRPFVPIDCGAIPENLLESEFFGHERGAFTGAEARRIGLLEFADGGTLFLDELGELPLVLQAKLLRALQERAIRRVGGREQIAVDLRVVAASAHDLAQMVRQGTFRDDLYYRINVVRIDLPPLAERGDDLGLLAEHIATCACREMGRNPMGITPEAFQVLRQYPWPGNVRELQNVIRRGVALSTDEMLGLDDLPDELIVSAGQREPQGQGFFQLRDQHVAQFEREYLTQLLRRHHGDVRTAAQEAQIPRGTLYRLMKNHALDSTQFRRD